MGIFPNENAAARPLLDLIDTENSLMDDADLVHGPIDEVGLAVDE